MRPSEGSLSVARRDTQPEDESGACLRRWGRTKFFYCMNVICKYAEMFREQHGTWPAQIVVTPATALALSLTGALSKEAMGIPIVCHDFDEKDVVVPRDEEEEGLRLGLFIKADKKHIAACTLCPSS